MKKIILIAASLLVVNAINAQQIKKTKTGSVASKQTPTQQIATQQLAVTEDRAQNSVNALNDIVGLTNEQKAKVLNLAKDKFTKIDAVNEKYKNDPERNNKSYAELEAAKTDYLNSVKSLLTADQAGKLTASNLEYTL